MSNWKDKTDFDINLAVTEFRFHGRFRLDRMGHIFCGLDYMTGNSPFAPCNCPGDAWPIIVENQIAIIPPVSNGTNGWKAERFFNENCGRIIDCIDKNPLRAAMIVYLKINGVKP